MRHRSYFVCLVTMALLASTTDATAQPPSSMLRSARPSAPTGWSPVVVPRGAYRAEIQATPIQQRPGRPLHVYGNTVRMIDQSRHNEGPARPLRQILLGTGFRTSEGRR